ncbi:MAG: diguanylate cyclase [Acidimicrobiales bacterium]
MKARARTDSIDELSERALAAASPEDRACCLRDIEAELEEISRPVERARLLICRAQVRHNQYEYGQVLDDARAAMALFEEAGETGLAVDAASRAAVLASRLGELSLAAGLVTKTVLGLASVHDDRLSAVVANRLGAFCCSLLDYDRGVVYFGMGLAAAERAEDGYLVCLELYNIANALLLAVRANRASDPLASLRPEDSDRLERAGQVLERLLAEVTPERQLSLSAQLLRAELLVDTGHPREALETLDAITNAAGGAGLANDAQRAACAVVESHCRRDLGQNGDAVAAAERAVQLSQASGDDYELMLTLEERLSAKRAAGDLAGVVADALEVKRLIWAVHQRQTVQIAEQIWERADLERERRQLEEQAAVAVLSAEEDALTCIGNRRLLMRFLDHGAEPPASLALVMADIDLFKEVNDNFGHELGDRVLRALGELLAGEVRSGQVVARYGGDEFVFAMPGAELTVAAGFAERIRLAVASYPWAELDPRLAVTISLGIASGRSDEWHSVLAEADDTLYLAKRHGRNRVEVASRAPAQTAAQVTAGRGQGGRHGDGHG